MGFLPKLLRITPINENRVAAGSVAAVNVTPAVADHPALGKGNAQFACGAQQHARLRLPAIAVRLVFAGVITDLHPVNRKPPAHFGVNRLDGFLLERAAAHVGLVRHHHEQEAGLFEPRARGRNIGKNFKLIQTHRRIRPVVALQSAVDDAVAVEENGWNELVGIGRHGFVCNN